MSDTTDDEVFFVYTTGVVRVPDDVVRVLVDPSVMTIPANAFCRRTNLAEVELCEGLVEIGDWSFWDCGHSITKINAPHSLRRINDWAFRYSLRTPIRLHDGIESIGRLAFAACIFTNFRVPPLITVIPNGILYECKTVFSVELPADVMEIGTYAFACCYCLRNVAFPPNAVIGYEIFGGQSSFERCNLYQLFGSIEEIISELQHRFDGLLIHSIVYYQSYHQGVLQNLMDTIKLDPTGNQQDCLGMTPLHILACSSVHNLEMYCLIVEKYPTNLITEDRWGATPLLYAFWGAAPAQIIDFLLESYHSLYPGFEFNWTMMVKTMGRTDTPKERIENLLHARQKHFPEQPIDWDYLLDNFANSFSFCTDENFRERMQFLTMCGMSDRVEALAFDVWRDYMAYVIHSAEFKHGDNGNISIVRRILAKATHFDDKYIQLKEITTILELALWKLRINGNLPAEEATHCRKKIKTDESSMRRQCRVTCGADVIIRNVLPFLISVVD